MQRTDPNNPDTDSDGLYDAAEIATGRDPNNADTDGDGIVDGFYDGQDTDGDGLSDVAETTLIADGGYETDPTKADTDRDGLIDGDEISLGTDPNNRDSDGDNLTDGKEVNVYKTNPLEKDTDGDGINDNREINLFSTDPNNRDTDGDGIDDNVERVQGSEPTDPNDPEYGAGPASAAPDHYNVEFLGEEDEPIDNGFSPYGNSLEINKYGDDGSSVIKDDSGVLIWVDSSGVFHRIPDSDLATPLKVTNNEVITWHNRFAVFENYESRPDAEVRLYRKDNEGNISDDFDVLPVQGKTILDTPQITTSTGGFVIATAEVILDDRVTVDAVITNIELGLTGINFEGYIDNLSIRYYNVTANGGLQFRSQFADQIRRDPVLAEPEEVQTATDLEVLGHGSDGSSLIKYTADITRFESGGRRTEVKYLWLDGNGRSLELKEQNGELVDEVSRLISVTNSRLVVENGAGMGLYDFRRSISANTLSGPVEIALVGNVMNRVAYTRVGDDVYFYSQLGDTIRTYRLDSDGATEIRVSSLPNSLGQSAFVNVSNPNDGSALISEENQENLVWLHDDQDINGPTGTFTNIDSSALARSLYVTNDECVLWENASARLLGDGSPEDVVVVHHELDKAMDGNTLRRILSVIEGNYVIDAPVFTPDFDYWFVNTSEKIDAATARLRSYKLASNARIDTDGDGLTDEQETNTGIYLNTGNVGTDPFDPDTDGDGLRDGDEVHPYYLVDGDYSFQEARTDARKRSYNDATGKLDGNVYRHLAVITSKGELEALKRRFGGFLANNNYWIGLDDLDTATKTFREQFQMGSKV